MHVVSIAMFHGRTCASSRGHSCYRIAYGASHECALARMCLGACIYIDKALQTHIYTMNIRVPDRACVCFMMHVYVSMYVTVVERFKPT
jgi:hypothetical protein